MSLSISSTCHLTGGRKKKVKKSNKLCRNAENTLDYVENSTVKELLIKTFQCTKQQ